MFKPAKSHWSTPPADQCWTSGCTQRRVGDMWCVRCEASRADDAARATAWLIENGGRVVTGEGEG